MSEICIKYIIYKYSKGYRISPVSMCVKEGSCTGNHHTTIYPKKNIHQIISKISLLCVVLIQASNIIKPLPLPPSNVGGCTLVERTRAAWRTPGGAAAGAAGAAAAGGGAAHCPWLPVFPPVGGIEPPKDAWDHPCEIMAHHDFKSWGGANGHFIDWMKLNISV